MEVVPKYTTYLGMLGPTFLPIGALIDVFSGMVNKGVQQATFQESPTSIYQEISEDTTPSPIANYLTLALIGFVIYSLLKKK